MRLHGYMMILLIFAHHDISQARNVDLWQGLAKPLLDKDHLGHSHSGSPPEDDAKAHGGGKAESLTVLAIVSISVSTAVLLVAMITLVWLAVRKKTFRFTSAPNFSDTETESTRDSDLETDIPPEKTPDSWQASSIDKLFFKDKGCLPIISKKFAIIAEISLELSFKPQPIHYFTYRELKSATQNFSNPIMSDPRTGSTFAATLKGGQEASVKVLQNVYLKEKQELLVEASRLGPLKHDRLVPILGFCLERSHRMIVFDRSSPHTLRQQLNDPDLTPLTWHQRVQIIDDMAEGLHALHTEVTPPILHKDLRPESIFLDCGLRAKVGEFGPSCFKSDEAHVQKPSVLRGVNHYLDPEYLTDNTRYSESSDVYSFGMVAMEVILGRCPTGRIDENDLRSITLDNEFEEDQLKILIKLCRRCTRFQSSRRPSTQEIRQAIGTINLGFQSQTIPTSFVPIN